MAKERWFANGYEITQGFVRDVEKIAGLTQTPSVVGKNAQINGRAGEVWVPKVHGPQQFVMNVWVGDDATESARDQLWDELVSVLCTPQRLVNIERHMRDGSVRTCQAEVLSAIAAEPIGMFAYRAGFEFSIPSGVWTGGTVYTASAAISSGNQVMTLAGLAGSTAPLDSLTVRVQGPAPSGVTVLDGAPTPTADRFTYNAAVPSGGTLIVNAATFQVTGTGFTPDLGALTYPGGRYLTVSPQAGGAPAVRVQGGSGSTVSVSGTQQFAA